MNKKAFTLIELIAVIAIIAIVSVVIVRFSNNIFSSVNQRAYELLLEAMQKGANDYLYITDLRLEDDGTEIITVSELIASGAIKSVKDPQNKEDCDGYVEVKRTDNKYVFFPYLHCGTNYITAGYGSSDEIDPVITILGDNPITLERGTAYTDAEATASDNIDGDITSKITTTSNLNINAYGTYNVTYTVYDSFNNTATAVRTINVTEDVVPEIAFSSNGNLTYAKSRSTKVTVSDDDSGIDSSNLKYKWTTNTNVPTEESFTASFNNKNVISTPVGVTGSYYLWILAKDKAGNTTISGTDEFRLDNTAPVITMLGSNPYNYTAGIYGTVYTDAGATASDNIDGNITSSIVATSDLNINLMGPYTVKYNVTDSAGNIASEVTRIIYSNQLQFEVIMWGAGGGGGGNSSYAAVGGGGAYATSIITAGMETLKVSVGGGGGGAANGCLANTGRGSAGSGTYGAAGGMGGNPSATGCSGPGGGGGGGSLLLRYSSILVAAGGGGGGGGSESCGSPGAGGGGGTNGGNGYNATGGTAGASGSNNGANGLTPTPDGSGSGGGGGGYQGGSAGGLASADCYGAAGGGGGTSYATTVVNGSGQNPGNSSDSLRAGAGVGGGRITSGTNGIVIIRYYGPQKASGGTVSTSGGYTTHTFTSSGAFSVVNNYGDYLAQFLDKDLVSYWKLDESSGNPADSSGGYTSTNSNVSYTTGKINNGGSFNGSTSYTVINNTTSVQFQNQITVSAWVKPASTINAWTDRGIFSKGGSSGNSFLITHIGDSTGGPNDMWGGFVTIAGDNRWVTGTTVPIVGNWYYVVLTYDNSNIKLYVNGNLEKVLAYTGNIQNYTENFVIGARSLSGGTPFRVFNGTIDEVAYWKRALTYGEINYLYNYGVGRQYPF